MLTRILKVSTLAAAMSATPAFAIAQDISFSTSSPVTTTSFAVNDLYAPGPTPDSAPQFSPGAIALRFVNKGNVAATAVRFTVNGGRVSQSIVDKGTFRPGVQIDHNFTVAAGLDSFSAATCIVVEVDFADGSVWRPTNGNVANR